jgi:hypothetical protein
MLDSLRGPHFVLEPPSVDVVADQLGSQYFQGDLVAVLGDRTKDDASRALT